MADYIQIGQTEPGKATLYVTAKAGVIKASLSSLFDLSNVNVDFEFKILDQPLRTSLGKLKLRV